MQYADTGQSRPERVGHLIREEIADLLTKGLKDPRIGMATVTKVGMSGDLRQATVYVSVYGPPDSQQQSIEGLTAAAGFIRHQLGQRLRLRHVPHLTFVLDDSIEHGIHMDRVLKHIAAGADEETVDHLEHESPAPVENRRDRTPAGGEMPNKRKRGRSSKKSRSRKRRRSTDGRK